MRERKKKSKTPSLSSVILSFSLILSSSSGGRRLRFKQIKEIVKKRRMAKIEKLERS
jgi:hypothetical protein